MKHPEHVVLREESGLREKPSIGRVVHYVEQCGTHKPAVVAAVHQDDIVDLTVFGYQNEPVSRSRLNILPDDQMTAHTWHWPEREFPELRKVS